SQPYLPFGRYQASLGHRRFFRTVSPAHTGVATRRNPCAFAFIVQARPFPAWADRFIIGMAPVDYDPVLLPKPFRPHLAVSALPSGDRL
ncbi:MAG: hypothetical protein ACREYC_02900, partial [Gammaproteobacteria bacterium]